MFEKNEIPVPGYRLIQKLGFGQYGEVWEAEGPGGTRVALKFIPIKDAKGEVELKSIQYVKLIRHANLVPIHAIWLLDVDGNTLESSMLEYSDPSSNEDTLVAENLDNDISKVAYLVICMTLADSSLQDRLNHAIENDSFGLPYEEVIDYMGQTARGLDFLNDQRHVVGTKTVGIQHRDIKPANLLLIGDTVVIGDFGVATTLKNFDATATMALGSLAFMAPESIGRRPSRASDQYSLAITYYQLRTGELPYDGSISLPELIDIHKTGKLDFNRVTQAEEAVLRKATAKDPKIRYATCREMVEAIANSVNQPVTEKRGLLSRVWGIGGLLSLIAISLLVWLNWNGDNDPNKTGIAGPQAFTLTFEPSNATHEIQIRKADGKPTAEKIKGSGDAVFELNSNESVSIVAHSTDPFYSRIKETMTFDQLGGLAGNKFELPKLTPDQVRNKAYKLLGDGERSAAVKLLAAAAGIDSSVLEMPGKSVVIGNPILAVNSLEAVSNSEFCIAIQDARNHSVGILRSSDGGIEFREINPKDIVSTSFIEAILHDTELDRLIVIRDDALQIADVGEGQDSLAEVWKQDEDRPAVEKIAIAPDRKLLAIGYSDSTVQVWPAVSQGDWQARELNQENDHGPIVGLAFGPENKNITVLHDGSPATRFQINGSGNSLTFDEQPLKIPEFLTNSAIVGVAVLGTDSVAIATEEKVYLGNVFYDSTQPPFEQLGDETSVDRMFTSNDGKWLLVSSRNDTRFQLWNVIQRQIVLQASSADVAGIWDVAFSDDGHRIAITAQDGSIYLVNLEIESPKMIKLFEFANEYCKLIQFAKDGDSLMGILDGRKNNGTNISRPMFMDLKKHELDLRVKFEMAK